MRSFTGKHMAATLCVGFGIVMAVNFYMASLATGGFGGVVVKNSYVASQKYNDWLQEAARQQATGWELTARIGPEGHVLVEAFGAPSSASLSGAARHPLGHEAPLLLEFAQQEGGMYVSSKTLPEGRWTLRLTLEDGDRKRVVEAALP